MRFRNYRNRHNKKNRIYSQEELLEMTLNNLFDNEPLILAQDSDIGIPSIEELRQSPNTRWIDKYTDEYGQRHGGYYGSIGDYDEFIAPKQKFPPIDKDRYKTYPKYMTEAEAQEEDEEENPIVLEGGVEENVYYPDEEQLPQEEDELQLPAEDGADDDNSRKSPLEIDNEEMTRILQDMLQDLTTGKSKNIQIPEIFQDIQDNTIEIPEQRHNVTLPKIGQFEQMSELEKLYKKLLEELRKRVRMRANNISNTLSKYNELSIPGEIQKYMNKVMPLYKLKNLEKNRDKEIKNVEDVSDNKTRQQTNTTSKTNEMQYIKPVEGKITSDFGYRKSPVKGASTNHSGIDIAVPVGTPIKVIADGTVIAANGGMRGYGNGIFIDHGTINGKRVVSEYGHLSKFDVRVGDKVKQGQIIAKSGNTGISSGPHLHITIRENKIPVDPKKYIQNLSD